MIAPTVGRIVWYWPRPSDALACDKTQPLAAIVARVWTDTCVNLHVIDANGVGHSKTSVLLWQEGDPTSLDADKHKPDAGFAEWMPYQKGQAAKAA